MSFREIQVPSPFGASLIGYFQISISEEYEVPKPNVFDVSFWQDRDNCLWQHFALQSIDLLDQSISDQTVVRAVSLAMQESYADPDSVDPEVNYWSDEIEPWMVYIRDFADGKSPVAS